jgi:hypothetical protein
VINVLIDCGKTLDWNWMSQAMTVAKSGKIPVRIDVIRDIVGVGCLMIWQFNDVDNEIAHRGSSECIMSFIQADSSRCCEEGGHNNFKSL